MNKSILFEIASFPLFIPLPTYAYIGPGMESGIIAITLGFLTAIFLALLGILYYSRKNTFNILM